MSYSLSFSKAVLVVIYIADKARQGQFEFLSTKMISEIVNIPRPTLVKIFQNLTAAGIIETREGRQGGIRLQKKPEDITVFDIFQAMESGKPLFQTSFDMRAQGKRPKNAQETLSELFSHAESQMKQTLSQKTIGEILTDMNES